MKKPKLEVIVENRDGFLGSRDELAAKLGVKPETISELAKRGVIKKIGWGKYDIEACTRQYIEHLRKVAANQGGGGEKMDLAAERAKLTRKQTEEAEIRIAKARGELVPASEVGEAMQTLVRTVRQHVLAIPGKIQQRWPGLAAAEVDLINQAVYESLTCLAEAGNEV